MPAEVRVFADADELGEVLAAEVLARYDASQGAYLLGCPGGRSLRTTYRALAAHGRPLDRLVVVMMDEYVGAPPGAHYSCTRFAHEEIAEPLGAAEVWLPDVDDPGAYDARISAAGGVDLFLLASGASDGHVAFVPPGGARSGRTSVIRLAETTRLDNLATFSEFDSLEDVPLYGVSVGLGTIAEARTVRLVLHGTGKRAAAARLLELDGFDPSWPASIAHDHPDAQIWIDKDAISA
ncbi:MAG TPA: 6-phosphogluconolactonase [Gaiellaceae bacterium]|nr:6-phosphogluconolactonase [Gaiellaceae bacterium]